MYDLYLKYEPIVIGIGKTEGIFKALFFFYLFNKKLIFHSALLPAVCNIVIYEKGLLEFDLERS